MLPISRISLVITTLLLIAFEPRISAQLGVDNGREWEHCNMDLSTFLAPPFTNMSHFIYRPVWNNSILLVLRKMRFVILVVGLIVFGVSEVKAQGHRQDECQTCGRWCFGFWQYTQSQDHVLTIIYAAPYTTGWVAMGISKDGMMPGSSAMVGWIDKEGNAIILQYHLRGIAVSQVIPNKGELPLTNVPPFVVIFKSRLYMAFQLKFDYHVTQERVVLAFSSKYPDHHRLTTHDDRTTILVDFSKASAPATPHFQNIKTSHGVLGTLGWGFLLPAGAIIARYLKHKDPLWYYLHTCIQFIGFIIVLAAVVLGTKLYKETRAQVAGHRAIGIITLVLSVLQMMAFFLRPNKDAKFRRHWNLYHHWFGRIALLLGVVNIVIGMQIAHAGDDWKGVFRFLISLVLLSVIVLEVLHRRKQTQQKIVPPPAFKMDSGP
ncbi:Cytochrome b561/ferric reductase transmembrane [Dillenia turbinata]|uniref:Cytochrome b561/ferric reductase transmembrane n=1 Tax=Dillenia turbinata TaxID=194707 RepID=A0AAN8UPU6_9MAGN